MILSANDTRWAPIVGRQGNGARHIIIDADERGYTTCCDRRLLLSAFVPTTPIMEPDCIDCLEEWEKQ